MEAAIARGIAQGRRSKEDSSEGKDKEEPEVTQTASPFTNSNNSLPNLSNGNSRYPKLFTNMAALPHEPQVALSLGILVCRKKGTQNHSNIATLAPHSDPISASLKPNTNETIH